LSSCGQIKTHDMNIRDSEHLYTNELIHESSPYLLQHAHNPVNWNPWGEEALQMARQENKMMIISIGYAACHWCHVMEHESFEDTAVARLMNENFISIKVDREERPDVDQVYMNAVQLISGRGGWPLNAFALPDGKPFYAGTYFPREDWIKVLEYFIQMYREQPETLREEAGKIAQGILSIEHIPLQESSPTFTMEKLEPAIKNLISAVDLRNGGLSRAPKFPMPSVWEYLLYYHYLSGNGQALEAVLSTLDNMAFGGIYDQVGGGFARYSTDENWHVPHFEKMLYDNAQMVSLYAHAWQVTKNPLYRDVVYETLDFIERELTSKEGGFYSSLDADSEGEEGKFYVWTKEEIEKILGSNAAIFMDYYNITEEGNWEEGRNILCRKQGDLEFAESYGLALSSLQDKITSGKSTLLEIRETRIRPTLDNKILTSWNALMLKGYIDACRVFGEERFLNSALKNADFLLKYAINEDGNITRNPKNDKSPIHGFLDDYAFTISAFIGLYQAMFDEKWLATANKLAGYVLKYFQDETSGMFYYTHEEYTDLIARNIEISDNVISGSNSEMARNLFALGNYFYEESYIRKSEQMLANVLEDVHRNIFYFSNWGILELNLISKPFEVAVLGDECEPVRKELDGHYLPDVLLSGGRQEGVLELHENKLLAGQTTIYVCRDRVCRLPVTEVSEALEQLARK
jgi:uncharacterized protein YyaL (SSP411 family)